MDMNFQSADIISLKINDDDGLYWKLCLLVVFIRILMPMRLSLKDHQSEWKRKLQIIIYVLQSL